MKIETTIKVQDDVQPDIKGKVEKKSGKRIGYNYIVVKSFKQSQKNDVVKCLYIKSLTDFGFCVIKEGSHGDTRDKQGRDIIDRLKWQKLLHEQLQGKLNLPRLLGHFEESGNYYLVIELIRGKVLQKVFADKRKVLRQSIIDGTPLGLQFLDYLIQMADTSEMLHANSIIHRDATPNNYIITPGGKVVLIDMEMCYSIQQQFPSPVFQLGTHGYMSPQQEAAKVPTVSEDIFAFGAIIFQFWTCLPPGKFMNERFSILANKVRFFIQDSEIANMVVQTLHPEADQRPSISFIRENLVRYKVDLQNKQQRPAHRPILSKREEILSTIRQAIGTLATPLLADAEKGWFSDDMKRNTPDDKHKLQKRWYASYNRGVTGVLYMLAQAKKAGEDVAAVSPFIEKSIELVKGKYIDRFEDSTPGLHFGSDGIAAVLASCLQNGLLDTTSEYLEWMDQLLQKKAPGTSVLSGVAGQGIANLLCHSYLASPAVKERLHAYATDLINAQKADGSWHYGHYRQKFTRRKIPRVIKGFAEGMAGNIYFLLEYGYQFDVALAKEAAECGLQRLIKSASTTEEIVQWHSSKNKEINYGWLDGKAGIALSFICAFELTGQTIYKDYAVKTLLGIPPDLIDGNLGQRNGLAGLGEVYLEAFRVFKEEEWYARADWMASVIMNFTKQHVQHGPYWLVENERQPVANFMIGNSGILHFLVRYCYPKVIPYPL